MLAERFRVGFVSRRPHFVTHGARLMPKLELSCLFNAPILGGAVSAMDQDF